MRNSAATKKHAPPLKNILTPREAADYLGLNKCTLDRSRQPGRWPHLAEMNQVLNPSRIISGPRKNVWRYRVANLDLWLALTSANGVSPDELRKLKAAAY